jgi:hypothetical protein
MDTATASGGGIEVVFAALEAVAGTLRQAAATVADVVGGVARLDASAAAAGDRRVEVAIEAFLGAWKHGAGNLARDAERLALDASAAAARYEALDRDVALSTDAARG